MSSAIETAKPEEAELLAPAITDLPTYRFTAEQYEQLIEAGILEEDAQVELLEGWIVPKITKNPPHDSALRNILRLLQQLVTDEWDIHSQSVLIAGASRPEPDVLIVRHDPNNYADRHPIPQEAALVIEVSERSLSRDRGKKQKIYAAAGIPEYWIVNLIDGVIEVYSELSPDGFVRRVEFGSEDSVLLVLAGKSLGKIAVDDVLP